MIEMASSITRKITTMKATGENDQKVANCRKQEDHKDDAHNEEQAQAGKYTIPSSAAKSSNNAQQQRVISHGLATFFGSHPTSCSHKHSA
jgi:hypothetical protein